MRVSLVIPVFNEEESIDALIQTILKQTHQPDEIVFVDGGSTDSTVKMLRELRVNESRYKLIELERAMPGKGRNVGTEAAISEWIAYTDAGIKLDTKWLENLVSKAKENPLADIIYGNYAPQLNKLFDKAATIAYVPNLRPGKIREHFIASCMVKRSVWKKAGGFPDWRAAEDLAFMEKVEKDGFVIETAPDAMVHWELRPDLKSTYKRFDLYSKYNVWANKQNSWHYGVAKQYAFVLLCFLAGILFSWYFFLLIPAWIIARTAKRIWAHRFEFGFKPFLNPLFFFQIIIITLVIDVATFSGWMKAIKSKPSV